MRRAVLGRVPLRWVVRSEVRPNETAAMNAAASALINS